MFVLVCLVLSNPARRQTAIHPVLPRMEAAGVPLSSTQVTWFPSLMRVIHYSFHSYALSGFDEAFQEARHSLYMESTPLEVKTKEH